MKKKIAVVFVSVVAFFGSAFSIMTYDNDVGMRNLLMTIHEGMSGEILAENAVTIGMFAYAIGLTFGVIFFFHHGGRKKQEPSPLEVQMRLYEQDVQMAMQQSASTKETEQSNDC